jgi:phospho-N-acetylmuramoyl-pentapeptide-transferase
MAFFGGIGFWDDFVKATGKDNRGIKARHKLLWQLIGCLLFFLSLWHFRGGAAGDHSLLQEVAYFLWTTLVIIATCNAANVTDGLDGLAAGLTVIAAASLGGVAIVLQRQEIAVCCFALAGASAGFLLYNTRRAMIFMGDTGSLAIGAGLAASALAMECELLVPLVALPFVIDALSVLLQVVAFKTTGRRIFRMAPIHHGFELRGWSEWRVVLSFWIVGAVCAGLAVVYFDALIEIEALGWAR